MEISVPLSVPLKMFPFGVFGDGIWGMAHTAENKVLFHIDSDGRPDTAQDCEGALWKYACVGSDFSALSVLSCRAWI